MSKENKTKTYNPEITKDDKTALGDKKGHLKTELSDDTLLKNRENKVDFTGKDLDIPGRNKNTKKKLKDEENQLYSQGSDDNEDLEITSEHIK
ncbi:hypothetical protein [Psychroserpens mesophilus]|uniref:hypothetical protein n=1 Tax=Psychroserpens mesophilus TaxID=325473 RepID=UPI003D660368